MSENMRVALSDLIEAAERADWQLIPGNNLILDAAKKALAEASGKAGTTDVSDLRPDVDLEDVARKIDYALMVLVSFIDEVAQKPEGRHEEGMTTIPCRDFCAIHLGICDIADRAHAAIVKYDADSHAIYEAHRHG